jgi:hypothetical protein
MLERDERRRFHETHERDERTNEKSRKEAPGDRCSRHERRK